MNVTPKGDVEVLPGGSSMAEPLNGPASVPVTGDAPTIFRPSPGASVELTTRLPGGKSSVITLSQGAIAVSQPGGSWTKIDLLGNTAIKCTSVGQATAAYAPAGGAIHWRTADRGSARPTLVHNHVRLGINGTVVEVTDECQAGHGLSKLHIQVLSGMVSVSRASGQRGRPSSKVLMTLQASDGGGKFHTKGMYSSATVLG